MGIVKHIIAVVLLLCLALPAYAAEEYYAVIIRPIEEAMAQGIPSYPADSGFRISKSDIYCKTESRVIECGDFSYALLPEGTAAITKAPADCRVLEFPSEIDGYVVTQIGSDNQVTQIGADSVVFSSPVEKIIIPDTVKILGNRVFNQCYDVKEVILPETLEVIAASAFVNCNATIQKLPEALVYIGDNGTTWMRLEAEKVELPKGLEYIGEYAFGNNGGVRELIVPASLKSIQKKAFENSVNLTKVTLEEGLKTLGNSMFIECKKLTSIHFPSSLEAVADSAFANCVKLTKVTFAENSVMISIEAGAFANCTQLSNIQLPEGLVSIANEAFYGCSKLAKVTIPESVQEIGAYAFEGCAKNLSFVVTEGSFAHQWAAENGLKHKAEPSKAKPAAQKSEATGEIAAVQSGEYRELRPGSKGQDVLNVRMKMYELGYFKKKPTQTEYTHNMQEYVRNFERDHNLYEDGIMSPEDQAVLFGL